MPQSYRLKKYIVTACSTVFLHFLRHINFLSNFIHGEGSSLTDPLLNGKFTHSVLFTGIDDTLGTRNMFAINALRLDIVDFGPITTFAAEVHICCVMLFGPRYWCSSTLRQ